MSTYLDLYKRLKVQSGAPEGYTPIPGSRAGGYRRRKGSGWEYWYPKLGGASAGEARALGDETSPVKLKRAAQDALRVLGNPDAVADRVFHAIKHTAHEFPETLTALGKLARGQSPTRNEIQAVVSVTTMIGSAAFMGVKYSSPVAAAAGFGAKFATHVAMQALHSHANTAYTGYAGATFAEKVLVYGPKMLMGEDAPSREPIEMDEAAAKDYIRTIVHGMKAELERMAKMEKSAGVFTELVKARKGERKAGAKYLSRKPDGRGGFTYKYREDAKTSETSETSETIDFLDGLPVDRLSGEGSDLYDEIKAMQEKQAFMRTANRILRAKNKTDEQKLSTLMSKLGIDQDRASQVLRVEDRFTGKPGYAKYQMSNLSGAVSRAKAKLRDMEADAVNEHLKTTPMLSEQQDAMLRESGYEVIAQDTSGVYIGYAGTGERVPGRSFISRADIQRGPAYVLAAIRDMQYGERRRDELVAKMAKEGEVTEYAQSVRVQQLMRMGLVEPGSSEGTFRLTAEGRKAAGVEDEADKPIRRRAKKPAKTRAELLSEYAEAIRNSPSMTPAEKQSALKRASQPGFDPQAALASMADDEDEEAPVMKGFGYLLNLSKAKPPKGFTPIPRGKKGGYRKRVGTGYQYWYPDTGVTSKPKSDAKSDAKSAPALSDAQEKKLNKLGYVIVEDEGDATYLGEAGSDEWSVVVPSEDYDKLDQYIPGYTPDKPKERLKVEGAKDMEARVAERIEKYNLTVIPDGVSPEKAREVARLLEQGIADNADLCEQDPPVCVGNMDIPRRDMPQIMDDPIKKLLAKMGDADFKRIKAAVAGGKSVEEAAGKDAKAYLDRLKGEAAVAAGADPNADKSPFDMMLDHLREQGVAISEPTPMRVGELKATQRDIQAKKATGMAEAAMDDKVPWSPNKAPIVISSDNHILDGHHRWAAMAMLGKKGEMKVIRVDLKMDELLDRSFDTPGAGVFRMDLQNNVVEGGKPDYAAYKRRADGKLDKASKRVAKGLPWFSYLELLKGYGMDMEKADEDEDAMSEAPEAPEDEVTEDMDMDKAGEGYGMDMEKAEDDEDDEDEDDEDDEMLESEREAMEMEKSARQRGMTIAKGFNYIWREYRAR